MTTNDKEALARKAHAFPKSATMLRAKRVAFECVLGVSLCLTIMRAATMDTLAEVQRAHQKPFPPPVSFMIESTRVVLKRATAMISQKVGIGDTRRAAKNLDKSANGTQHPTANDQRRSVLDDHIFPMFRE